MAVYQCAEAYNPFHHDTAPSSTSPPHSCILVPTRTVAVYMTSWDSLDNGNLTTLCRENSTVYDTDQNCPCLLSGGGPEINTDVSGPGVRISFYLQALLLALLAARSDSLSEISNALYTLIVTNISMVTTFFILGFKSKPEMSLHDALVVSYLLVGSWLSIFFSLPSYNRYVKRDWVLQSLTVLHSYVIFAFLLAVLATAHSFGKTPRCNTHAVAVIFYHFPALNGRIAALVSVCLIICTYSAISVGDYRHSDIVWLLIYRAGVKLTKGFDEAKGGNPKPLATPAPAFSWIQTADASRNVDPASTREHPTLQPQARPAGANAHVLTSAGPINSVSKKARNKARSLADHGGSKGKPNAGTRSSYGTGVLGYLVVEIFVIVVLWSLFVMNTELLIRWNRFDGGGDGLRSDLWGFGQILPMLLVLLPFVQVVKAFRRLGLKKRSHRIRKHRCEPLDVEKPSFHPSRATRFARDIYGIPNSQPSARISLDSIHSEGPVRSPRNQQETNSLSGTSCSSISVCRAQSLHGDPSVGK